MTSDTDTPRDASSDEIPADPLKVPDEHADDEATQEAFRDGFARALLLMQSTTANFLKLATLGAESTDGLEPPDDPAESSGLADLIDEVGGDGRSGAESSDDRPQQLGADNL